MPESVRHLQVERNAFPERYLDHGIYGLIKLQRLRDEYDETVFMLAQRIVQVAEETPLPSSTPRPFESTPSAFAPPGDGPRRIHLTVAAPARHRVPEARKNGRYGESSLQWNPYSDETPRPIATLAEELIRSLDYRITVSDFDNEDPTTDELAAGGSDEHPGAEEPEPGHPAILLVDCWAVLDEDRRRRLKAFDANARRQTAFASLEVVPDLDDDVGDIEIKPEHLQVDTFRAGGKGGQHVNKTESAIRITHIPSGIIVACQAERSQHKNRATAMGMLKARLYEAELQKREAAAMGEYNAKTEIGWGHQIRSYVLQPYQLVKDLRTGVTSTAPSDVLDGDLDAFMAKVLARRDDNWKKLQQYVLEEREAFDLTGPGGLPLYGMRREYSWFIRNGVFVRRYTNTNFAARHTDKAHHRPPRAARDETNRSATKRVIRVGTSRQAR